MVLIHGQMAGRVYIIGQAFSPKGDLNLSENRAYDPHLPASGTPYQAGLRIAASYLVIPPARLYMALTSTSTLVTVREDWIYSSS